MALSLSRLVARRLPDRRPAWDCREIHLGPDAPFRREGALGAPVIVDPGLFVASEDSEEGLSVGQMMLAGVLVR